MAKGSKRYKWLKEGIKDSRKVYKHVWNRKIRHSNKAYKNCEYKRIARDSIYAYVT